MAGPQGGRTADYGSGEGGVAEEATRLVTPSAITTTGGGDPATGSPLDPDFKHGENQSISFGPLPPPLMPKKDTPQDDRSGTRRWCAGARCTTARENSIPPHTAFLRA